MLTVSTGADGKLPLELSFGSFESRVLTGGLPVCVASAPWTIHGADSQILEIALQPGESAIAEPGSMCYTSNDVKAKMTSASAMGSFFSSEAIFKPKYTNTGQVPGFVAFTVTPPEPHPAAFGG